MPEVDNWNARIVEQFRANGGRVGGNFQGAPLVLLHHSGRSTGREYITPLMYLPHETKDNVIYVFATRGGDPANPDWYYNLTAEGVGSIERGLNTYRVTVRDLVGDERDRVYAEQASRYSGFSEYAKRTEGVRVIPVLELTQS
jgi:deazaflavin-dependent oxidoreductase (nitroreductase family)